MFSMCKWNMALVIVLSSVLFSVNLYAQNDTIMQFRKDQVLRLANGVQSLQDTLRYVRVVDSMKTKIISLYEERTLVYEKQLTNREQVILACKEETNSLRQVIETLKPKWYDNKFIWVGAGATLTGAVILLVK
jgi:hypothetical protein